MTDPLTGLIRAALKMDEMGAGPPHTPPPALTLADQLDLISDTLTNVESTGDDNSETLEAIAAAVETNGNTLTDILAVLEDIRDLLTAAADRAASDD